MAERPAAGRAVRVQRSRKAPWLRAGHHPDPRARYRRQYGDLQSDRFPSSSNAACPRAETARSNPSNRARPPRGEFVVPGRPGASGAARSVCRRLRFQRRFVFRGPARGRGADNRGMVLRRLLPGARDSAVHGSPAAAGGRQPGSSTGGDRFLRLLGTTARPRSVGDRSADSARRPTGRSSALPLAVLRGPKLGGLPMSRFPWRRFE